MTFLKNLIKKLFGQGTPPNPVEEEPVFKKPDSPVDQMEPASLEDILKSHPPQRIKTEVQSLAQKSNPFKKEREEIQRELKNLDPDVKKYE